MKWDFYQPKIIHINESIQLIIEELYQLIWVYSLSNRPFEKEFTKNMIHLLKTSPTITVKQYHTLIDLYETCLKKKVLSISKYVGSPNLFEDPMPTAKQFERAVEQVNNLKSFYSFAKPVVSNKSNYIAVGLNSDSDAQGIEDRSEIYLFNVKTLSKESYVTVNDFFASFFCFSPDEKYFTYIDGYLLPAGPVDTYLIQLNIVCLKTNQKFKIFPSATISDNRNWYFKYSNTGRYLAVLTWKNGVQIYDTHKLFVLILEVEGHKYDTEEDMYRLKRTFPDEVVSCATSYEEEIYNYHFPQSFTHINKRIYDISFSDDETKFKTYAEYNEVKEWNIPKV